MNIIEFFTNRLNVTQLYSIGYGKIYDLYVTCHLLALCHTCIYINFLVDLSADDLIDVKSVYSTQKIANIFNIIVMYNSIGS